MILRKTWLIVLLVLIAVAAMARAQAGTDVLRPVILMSHRWIPQGISGGGPVDTSCQATVFFEATISDNCCIQTESVTVDVVETTGRAVLGDPIIIWTHFEGPPEAPEEGQAVRVEGSVLVSSLTGCPAIVQVTLGAADCAGNEADPVVWTQSVVDQIPPEIICPDDVSVVSGPGVCLADADPGLPIVTDNCDSAPQVQWVRSDGLGLGEPFPCGETIITWTATDSCGNEATCEQVVTIRPFPRPPGSGGGGGSGSASFNQSPIPNAGQDQIVCVGEYVCLDASASYDPDAGFNPGAEESPLTEDAPPLEYSWEFATWHYENGRPVLHIPEGSRAVETLESEDTAFACFKPDLPGDYVLVLTTEDEYGATAVDEITLHARQCSEVYGCSYPGGWNLLSLPAQPVDARAEAILGTTSADTPAYTYDRSYIEAATLNPLKGYWVHFVTPDTVTILGRRVQNDITVRLEEPGWHLISSPFSIPWDRVLVFVNGAERFVGEEVSRNTIDDRCVCYDAQAGVYRISDRVLPCQGYWIRTHESDVVLKFEWTSVSQVAPPAEGGCATGETTTLVPIPPNASQTANYSPLAYPNPVRHSTVHFKAQGMFRCEQVRVEVFTLAGDRVWAGIGDGDTVEWVPQSEDGGRLPWGPYIYCMEARVDGRWTALTCSVLFLAELD